MNDVEAKDPDEVKYYAVDWTSGLNDGATISASSWSLQTGLTAGATGITGAVTRVLISGGLHRTDYTVTNTITTSDGETLERSGILRVRNSA